jgi:type VI secretion system protein ImpK
MMTSNDDNITAVREAWYPQPFVLSDEKWLPHHPKAGLNPLVDTAGYLFSLLGRLKQLTSYQDLHQLQNELTAEIHQFQEAAKAKGYRSEYTLVSRYALCVTFDDIIANTAWGDPWQNYRLLTVFNPEAAQQDRFFVILERIIKEPALYIDIMEFMYVCLSLGYKGSYRSPPFADYQLDKVTHALYQRIRTWHGDFSKTLSPAVGKTPKPAKSDAPNISWWRVFLFTVSVILLLFIGLGYMLDTISDQAYQALMHIGKSIFYEIHGA